MKCNSAKGGNNDQNIIQSDAADAGIMKNEKIPKIS